MKGSLTTHMSVCIQGFLNQYENKSMAGLMIDNEDNNRPMSDSEIRTDLKERLSKGEVVLPMSNECNHFDKKDGCQCKHYNRVVLVDVWNGEGYSSPVVKEISTNPNEIAKAVRDIADSYNDVTFNEESDTFISLNYDDEENNASIFTLETNDFNKMLIKIMPDICSVEILDTDPNENKLLEKMHKLIKEGNFEEDDVDGYFLNPEGTFQFGSHDDDSGFVHYEIV